MSKINKHGLSRDIPLGVAREVRALSKFGCVICRSGFFQYEHIEPTFEDAKFHDPEKICCLCASCHDAVTRRQYSKAYVQQSYERIKNLSIEEVRPPVGPLDFHDGSAELCIGGLLYSPSVKTVLRYKGEDIFTVKPGKGLNDTGSISAKFFDDSGNQILVLDENKWVGSLKSWDIQVVGQRLKVRKKKGLVSLQLRLDPPGRVVVEKLDMKIFDAHILANEHAYAVGRYFTNGEIGWASSSMRIAHESPNGIAIDISSQEDIANQVISNGGKGIEEIMLSSNGYLIPVMGVAIARNCNHVYYFDASIGIHTLKDMRKVLNTQPGQVVTYIKEQSF